MDKVAYDPGRSTGHIDMKKTALAALLATTVLLMPWRGAEATDFLYGQRLYSLGDYPGAMIVWRDLALQGDARAQYSLAVMYQKGQGVELDKVKAKEWARRAAEQGYEPGRRLLAQMQAGTSGAKLAKPRKAASQMTELERTEAAVEDLLRQIGGKIARDGSLRHGDLQAEELDGAIQIIIPDIVIQSAEGGIFELGDVLAHVRHLDERYDDITLALPGDIRFRNSNRNGTGSRSGNITIANRLAKLRWDRQLETSTEFEFRLGQIVFISDENGEMGRINEVLAQADVIEVQGLWSGPFVFSLDGLSMTNIDHAAFNLDSAKFELDFQGLDLRAYARISTSPPDNDAANTAALPPLETILTLASGLGLRARIAGLSMQSADNGAFQLASADYGVVLSSPDQKVLNLALTARHDGLNGTGGAAPAATETMVPRDLNIVLSLENLPIETLVSVGVGAAVEIMLLGQVNSGTEVFQRLRRDLGAASTALRLQRADVRALDYTIAFHFTLLSDAAAKAGMVGGGDLRITGLKKILAALGVGEIPLIAGLIEKGRPTARGGGVTFALAVRPDGQLTVNGEAVISLLPPPKKPN